MSSLRQIASYCRLASKLCIYGTAILTAYAVLYRPGLVVRTLRGHRRLLQSRTVERAPQHPQSAETWDTRFALSSSPDHRSQLVSGDVRWSSDDGVNPSFRGFNASILTPMEEALLSKAFGGSSMRQEDVVPFYYSHGGKFDREDITITTLITKDRFPVFNQLVSTYEGEFMVIYCLLHLNSMSQGLFLSLFTSLRSLPIREMPFSDHFMNYIHLLQPFLSASTCTLSCLLSQDSLMPGGMSLAYSPEPRT
jgi:hypothetical protein